METASSSQPRDCPDVGILEDPRHTVVLASSTGRLRTVIIQLIAQARINRCVDLEFTNLQRKPDTQPDRKLCMTEDGLEREGRVRGQGFLPHTMLLRGRQNEMAGQWLTDVGVRHTVDGTNAAGCRSVAPASDARVDPSRRRGRTRVYTRRGCGRL